MEGVGAAASGETNSCCSTQLVFTWPVFTQPIFTQPLFTQPTFTKQKITFHAVLPARRAQ